MHPLRCIVFHSLIDTPTHFASAPQPTCVLLHHSALDNLLCIVVNCFWGGKGACPIFLHGDVCSKKHLKYTGFLNITHCNTLERGLKCSAQSKFTVLIQKKWRFSFKAISNLATHVGHSVLNSSTLDLIGFMYTQLIMTAGHGKRKPLQNCIAILLCFAARGQNVSLLNAILPFSGEGGWSSTKCSSS